MSSRRGVVPFVPQTTEADCAAACLVMALRVQGQHRHLHDVRAACGVGRDGASAVDIIDAAQSFGAHARAVRVDLDTVHLLPKGTILHWELRHFVVFERLTKSGAIIVDPAAGRRRIGARELDRALGGVGIIVESKPVGRTDGPGRPTLQFLFRALRQAPELPQVLTASVAIQLLVGLLPIVSASVIDRVVPRHDEHLLTVLTFGVIGLAIFYAVFGAVRGLLLAQLRARVDLGAATRLIDHIVSLPVPFFQIRPAGDLMVRVRSNETLREALSSAMLASVLDGALVAMYVCVLVVIDPWIAAVVTALVAVQLATYLALRRRHRELVAEAQHRQGIAEGHLIDTLEGIETLKVAGAEGRAVSRWTSHYVEVLNATLRRARLTTWSDTVVGTVRTAGPFVVLLVGTEAVLRGAATLGTLLAALALAHGIITSIGTLLTNFGEIDALTAMVDRLDDIFIERPEQPEERPAAAPLGGRITLRGVGFRPTSKSAFLVRNVSLDVAPGAFVAVVGASGSGKSTVVSLLTSLFEPTEGEILLDGVPMSALDLRSVRRQMGVVVQRAQVFGTNIRDNITMLEDLPPEDIEAAARLACVHDDIQAMGRRYLTGMVGGGAVSGGQRQRIALARALIKKPRILLLDEATSALDAITEQRIFANIRDMGCTRVVVAHRLSTIMDADLIVVMDGGEVVETGTHEDLIAQAGHYAALVAAQNRGEPHGAAAESGA